MQPDALRHCLLCPVCRRVLTQPTTLPCGHTVCAHHQTVPCPLPQCAPPAGPARPRIPPGSRVNYLPPPPPPPLPPQPQSAPKLDVTLNKVIALLDSVLGNHEDSDDEDDPPRTPTVRHRPESPDRPRKRQRMHDSDDDEPDLLTHLRAVADRERPLPDPPLEKELHTELSCEICFMLLYNPVTTPCQHVRIPARHFMPLTPHRPFAQNVSTAPWTTATCVRCAATLCRASPSLKTTPLTRPSKRSSQPRSRREYTARADAIAAEERDARLDIPIFVCMLIFPGHPTALHFFEPRYRLMLRRCLEQDTPSFGMIMPARPGAGPRRRRRPDRLRHHARDGRSMVETWSTYRFRILERGTLDGYTVARIERIDDVPDSPVLTALDGPSNEELMDTCTQFLQQLRRGTAPWVVQRLNNFAYWVALVLPIDEFEKAKLLPIRSARLRLRLVVHWIEQLSNNWWFTRGGGVPFCRELRDLCLRGYLIVRLLFTAVVLTFSSPFFILFVSIFIIPLYFYPLHTASITSHPPTHTNVL
ncbi:hypothetical protein MSAN_01449800 [Mycena sanguinolenta]|uniref:Lon N-terminal domain-containing protein n=1 Tax=Mycena sanguinolenta TaxID=230812 RepID=A0A8H7D1J4_9AGAR|nr:hypothetical protein MSAN_01449800 [Mycena sanguinolenta]